MMPEEKSRRAALALTPVSRETAERLDVLVAQLRRWQTIKNLVSPQTLDQIWLRHIADSLQLLPLAPKPDRWLDLGSGGGFPGLVLAAALVDQPGARVHLVESNGRKCAFLREVARCIQAPVEVHHARIEDVIGGFAGQVDVVSARALAPLPQLLEWCGNLLTTGVVGLFPKGQDLASELTQTAKSWMIDATIHNSLTDPQGRILRVTGVTPLAKV